MDRRMLYVAIFVVVGFSLLFFGQDGLIDNGDLTDRAIDVCFGEVCFVAAVADDSAERARGLMGVAYLPEDYGMLFVFESVGSHRFWMKDTLIDLDMIFIDSDFRVVEVVTAVPCTTDAVDCLRYGGNEHSLYVFEIKGGLADVLGIGIGDEVNIDL
ncbi:MAG: uncharacterized membrane protein (UPF0127 family) [Patescibacteria group bacterium]|jgi:uncharacterized membrane protein (UPF0127 family)